MDVLGYSLANNAWHISIDAAGCILLGKVEGLGRGEPVVTKVSSPEFLLTCVGIWY